MQVPEAFESGISALQKGGILKEIIPESLPKHLVKTVGALGSINLLVLSCCDGHQFMDLTQRTKFCAEQLKNTLGMGDCHEDCFHWKTVHGGPYVLSVPNLKVQSYRGEPEYTERHVLRELEEGMQLKMLNVLLLLPHGECGKMKGVFRDPEEYVEHNARSKERAMSIFGLPTQQVISWQQFHRSKGRRTYHVDYSGCRQSFGKLDSNLAVV